MSDQSDVPATEPDEAAQVAAEQQPASPPWGDDFDAQRAWDTITKLRGFEKQAKEFERIQSDEEARTAWLKSQGYEFAESDEASDSDELEFEDDDAPQQEFRDPRVDALLEERAREQIKTDLDRFNADSGWELDDDDRRRIEVDARLLGGDKGFGPAELEKAHKAYIERLDRAAEARQPKPKTPVPTPPSSGRAGEQQFDRKGATSQQRRAERQARIAAMVTAEQQES